MVVGGGPAGLMAAEVLLDGGQPVVLYDAMPSVGRKLLLAGIGGLNLSHAEPLDRFQARYGPQAAEVGGWLQGFGPAEVRAWAAGLGVETFVGSSGRVFPRDMKAAPLLRAWLHRLRGRGLRLQMRHRWNGLLTARALAPHDAGREVGEPPGALPGQSAGAPEDLHSVRPGPLLPEPAVSTWCLGMDAPDGPRRVEASVVVLALGGGSWRKLGSDGAWPPWLAAQGVDVATLRPANCGFDAAAWSAHLAERFAGAPLKSIAAAVGPAGRAGEPAPPGLAWVRGEAVVTAGGVEGSLVYAHAAALRDAIDRAGEATLWLDLLPGRDAAWVAAELAHPRGSRSWSTHLKTRLALHGVKAALLREALGAQSWADATRMALAIKALPLRLVAARPIDEAISSAGGVRLGELDAGLMLKRLPGVFCCGEMLDWEAPTGGYLLTACLASGHRAGTGALHHLAASALEHSSA